jgi:FkbM family methyltransferase
MTDRSLFRRVVRFVRSETFRSHPLNSVARRLAWHARWRLRRAPPRLRMPLGYTLELAHTNATSPIYFNRTFSDPPQAQFFIDAIEPGMTAIDCGAHIGEYSLLFSVLVGPAGRVHAFEPDPRVAPFLRRNVALNRADNVVVNEMAIANVDGTLAFTLDPEPSRSALSNDGDAKASIKVPVTSLDAYVATHSLAGVDAIKVDVEGVALAFLSGAERVFRELRPTFVSVECEGAHEGGSVATALAELGYEVAVSSRHVYPHVTGRLIQR